MLLQNRNEVKLFGITGIGLMLFLTWTACSEKTEDHTAAKFVLRVVDSLGVETGDSNQIFGDINGLCFVSDSAFVVFDRSYQQLRLFTIDGEHLVTESYLGDGPLEYRFAEYLAPLDSCFGVFDFEMPPRCILFNSELVPVSSVTLQESSALTNPAFLGAESIIGSVGSFEERDGSLILMNNTCKWNYENGIREILLYENFSELGSFEEGYGSFVDLEHCIETYKDSLIFIAPDLNESRILTFTSDGVCRDTIAFELTREPRSIDEIELEVTWRKLRDGNLGDWYPSELEPGITQLQVQDSNGLLWVTHGSRFSPEFEVFDIDGNHMFSCSCSGLPERDYYRFCISDEGYIAYTMHPEDYPRIYLLELVEETIENRSNSTGPSGL